MAERIRVNVPDSPPYEIVIERGLLAQLGQRAVEFGLNESLIIGTNTMLESLYAEQLEDAFPYADVILMPDGEVHKHLGTVEDLYEQVIHYGADRHTTLLAFGGGVVGDTVGFVAATYMRGIRFVQMPTSLLAMVDSSVGAKVGVDLPQGKNLVGAFKQPDYVLIDTAVLDTLSDEQWRCGMAEVIKHGFLADEGLLDSALHSRSRAEELVSRAIRVKVAVVEKDPYEQTIRAHLNLGHTFGHAIEQVTQYQWQHGEGVGFGLLAAATLARELGMIEADLVQRTEHILAEIGLPRRLNGIDSEAIYNAMLTDKKWKAGQSRFVLLEGMCKPTIVKGVPKEKVISVLESLQ